MELVDLERRIELTLNYFNGCVDRAQGFLPYFTVNAAGRPAHMQHAMWDDGDVSSRFLEALLLIRRLTHLQDGREVEEALKARLAGNIRKHGLLFRGEHNWCQPHAWMFDQGRCLLALAEWAREEPERVRPLARQMIRTLKEIAVKEEEYWYYPVENWTGEAWGEEIIGHPPTGMPIEGLVNYYLVTKDEEALDLAGKLVMGVIQHEKPLWDDEGNLLPGGHNTTYTHMHGRLATLIGMYKYCRAANDPFLPPFLAVIFEKILALGSSFGWIPESLENGCGPTPETNINELCCLTDALTLLLLQGAEGDVNAYRIAERFIYNQLVKQQITTLEPFEPLGLIKVAGEEYFETEEYSFHHVGERMIGGFQGAVMPNEFLRILNRRAIIEASGCCSPSGAKALCLALQHTITELPDAMVQANMFLPAESDSLGLRIDPNFPECLRLWTKRPITELAIRQPEWSEELTAFDDADDHPVFMQTRDRFCILEFLPAGASLLIKASPLRRITEETFGGGAFMLTSVGPEVVDMQPKGKYLPVYAPTSPFGRLPQMFVP